MSILLPRLARKVPVACSCRVQKSRHLRPGRHLPHFSCVGSGNGSRRHGSEYQPGS